MTHETMNAAAVLVMAGLFVWLTLAFREEIQGGTSPDGNGGDGLRHEAGGQGWTSAETENGFSVRHPDWRWYR